MGEKDDQKKSDGEKATVVVADGGGKKEEGPITVVLNLDLHCEGCAKKVRRSVNHFQEKRVQIRVWSEPLCLMAMCVSLDRSYWQKSMSLRCIPWSFTKGHVFSVQPTTCLQNPYMHSSDFTFIFAYIFVAYYFLQYLKASAYFVRCYRRIVVLLFIG